MRQSFSRFVCCIVIRGVHECQSTWISEQVCKVIWVIANHHFTKKNTNEERKKKREKIVSPTRRRDLLTHLFSSLLHILLIRSYLHLLFFVPCLAFVHWPGNLKETWREKGVSAQE